MKYDSLLLNCGGGIINPATKSPQFSQAAALCIGIGGTGIAALSDLKGKIYQQLEADNPDESIPRYEAIQLLGIDSDETMYKSFSGNRRLREEEFFTIKMDNIKVFFEDESGKNMIRTNPLMNWMDIDNITQMLSPDGAGGVRQMGRFLLFNRATALHTEIKTKCTQALKKRGGKSLDVYIFAGISGGTGSGCFLDTCYLVRKVVAEQGWDARIMGYFFLPDVVTSIPKVANSTSSVAYNNSNGFAAMKELDYLMNLQQNGDWFEQSYGSGLTIRTQQSPVDMCHLISAQRADGSLVPDGFNYGINVASDYAMAYLAEVDLHGESAADSKMTMRGHLSNVNTGVLGIPRRWGANLSYHILGASNAEIPMTQINTYLAAGFFRKFARAVNVPRSSVTKSVVDELMERLQLKAGQVYESVVADTSVLELPEIDRKNLAAEACCPEGKLPRTWGTVYNDWFAKCNGIMTNNGNALNKKLDGFDHDAANVQSLIGRLFRKLWDISRDPQFGPYYAAYLLSNNGEDLLAALDGEIKTAEGQKDAQIIQLPDMKRWVVQLNQDLIDHKGGKKYYDRYYGGVKDWLNTEMAELQCGRTAEVLREFRSQVQELYNGFFRPLCELLDNLRETFAENSVYMESPESAQSSEYTWQILKLSDIQPRLNGAIEQLNATQVVDRFVESLLEHSEVWLKNDSDRISMYITNYMLALFSEETNRSLQDYLFDKFPNAKGDAAALADEVKVNILDEVDRRALPMFWSDPTYPIFNPEYTFESSSLTVPGNCSVICTAANDFSGAHAHYAVRQTGIGDRIFALRFVSGIPLFAYQGVTKLKAHYDAAGTKGSGAGSHLYSNTGRGDSLTEWRVYIPTPMPYSKNRDLQPEGESLAQLYHLAVEKGVIGSPDGTHFNIYMTPDLAVRDYTLRDFMDGEVFSKSAYEAELKGLIEQLQKLHDVVNNPRCKTLELKNDGDPALCEDKELVRIDYFILSTVMHKIVRDELDKVARLNDAIEQLEKLKAEYFSYEDKLKEFTALLFRGFFECRNALGNINFDKTASVLCKYQDRYGEEAIFYLTQNTPVLALHKAFTTYRERIGGTDEVWNTIADELERLQTALTRQEDLYVPAILEQIWDNRAMDNLREKTLKGESEDVQKDVLRFYNGLRACIRELKNTMSDWPKQGMKELTALVSGEGAPQQAAAPAELPEKLYLWVNNETLAVWPRQYPGWALNETTGAWVQLNPGMAMWVWSEERKEWEKARLDPQGNILLG